jgi:hypothetical protein
MMVDIRLTRIDSTIIASHVDSAQAYRNQKAVGAAIQESGIERGELFLSTFLVCYPTSNDRDLIDLHISYLLCLCLTCHSYEVCKQKAWLCKYIARC